MQTVRRLIQELQGYDLDLPVITPGSDEIGVSLVDTRQVEIYHGKPSDRLEYRDQKHPDCPGDYTINNAILLTFGDEMKVGLYLIKQRYLYIKTYPEWVRYDRESKALRIHTFVSLEQCPDNVEDLKDSSGNLDKTKLEEYLSLHHAEYIEEYFVDKHGFTSLSEANEYAERQAFPHGFTIDSVPFN